LLGRWVSGFVHFYRQIAYVGRQGDGLPTPDLNPELRILGFALFQSIAGQRPNAVFIPVDLWRIAFPGTHGDPGPQICRIRRITEWKPGAKGLGLPSLLEFYAFKDAP
jgi:hypothetical protein